MLVPRRIVVINDASTARGGATGLALLSVRLLRQKGYAVTYVCGDDGGNPELAALGAEVVSVGQLQLVAEPRLKAFTRGIYNPLACRTLASWIAANDTAETVYHVHGWSKIMSPSIFSALRGVADRTVIHAHDFFLVCPNGAYMDYRRGEPCLRVPLGVNCLSTNCDKRSYAQKVWRVAREGVLRQTLGGDAPWAAFVMIHEAMAPFLAKGGLPPERFVTIRNPTEPLSDHRIPAEQNASMVFIGRVVAEKGIEDAITAARDASIPLRVIGDGPLRERLAADHPWVEFLGWRSRTEMFHIVRDARFLVMPSRYPEPFGLVAAEASASGLPVLLSNTAFLSAEVVENGVGFACDTRDPERFAEAVRHLRDMSKADMRVMSERAYLGNAKLSTSPLEWIQRLTDLYGSAVEVNRHERGRQQRVTS